MELVPSEPPKTTENPATQETLTSVVDIVGTIARKGAFFEEYYENSGNLDPSEFNGYSDYALDRSTLPEERRNPEKPIATVGFLKKEGQVQTTEGYEIYSTRGNLKMFKKDKVETQAEIQRQAQRRKEMNQPGEKGEAASLELMQELYQEENKQAEMRKTGESLVGEEKAQEILTLLKKIDETPKSAPPKQSYNAMKLRNLIRLSAASKIKDS